MSTAKTRADHEQLTNSHNARGGEKGTYNRCNGGYAFRPAISAYRAL